MTTLALTQGSRVARSALWNIAGQGLPLVVAVVAIPRLLAALGLERFGVLTLAWVLIGYFSLFDLGLSWALTRLVSERLAQRRDQEVPTLVWTSLVAMAAFGALGGVLLAGAAPWLTELVLKVPVALRGETRTGLVVLSVSLPLLTCSAGLLGVLGALQRFDLVSAVRVPMGIGFYLGPLLALRWGTGLPLLFGVLVAVRALGACGALAATLGVVPSLRRRPSVALATLGPLLAFGGWMTVTSVVGPFMLYLDRFVIGALRSMAEVAYYATPYEVTTRLLLIATPVAGVLFPAFAAAFAADRQRAARLFESGTEAVLLALFPCMLVLGAFAPELLGWWLGPDMGAHSAGVMRWLAAGVLVNGVAQVALSLVQSCGRPDWSARLHLFELPAYALVLVLLVRTEGVTGAAIAWTLRVSVDAIALTVMANRLVSTPRPAAARRAGQALVALAFLAAAALVPTLAARAAITLVGVGVATWIGVRRIGPRLLQALALERVA